MATYRCEACGAFNRVPADRPSGRPVCGRCKAALDTSGRPQEVDAEGFRRAVEGSPLPVLVDFWAPWCGPCRMAAPVLEQVAQANAGRVLTLKLNTEEHPAPSTSLGVRGIPTFVVFRDGREVARQSGLMPAQAMARWVEQASR